MAATHGPVGGQIASLAELALALTIPKEPTELDDGLLTASEVAQLKLNADWVLLSACNTAAGEKPGAEALSGLARALLVAGGFEDPPCVDFRCAGRTEALRRATLAMIEDRSSPWNAYPDYWGPFLDSRGRRNPMSVHPRPQ